MVEQTAMFDDFLLRGLVGALGVALIAGPLGCFIVWRRMAYFGDSLAHSALLGVALGIVIGVNPSFGIILISITLATFLVLMQQQQRLASDTLLGIMAHSGLALGLVALSFFDGYRVDLFAYLFGDVLAVTVQHIYWIYGVAVLALCVLVPIWQPLLLMTVDETLAHAEGVPVMAVRLALVLLIALVIAVAMKIVGVLLITSLLIIPAATARQFSRTPEQMALLAILAGALAVSTGLFGSLTWDTPSGPSIVVAALVLFILSLATGRLRRSRG